MKNKSKTSHHLKIIIFAVVVLGITILVSFLYNQGFIKETPVKLNIVYSTPTPIQWQNYTSDKYGFIISYPPEWETSKWDLNEIAELSTVPDNSIRFQLTAKGERNKFELLIWENRSKQTANDWVSNILYEEIDRKAIPEESNVSIVNVPAWEINQISIARKKPVRYVFFNRDDLIYEFIFELSDNLDDNQKIVYQKILASFAFKK